MWPIYCPQTNRMQGPHQWGPAFCGGCWYREASFFVTLEGFENRDLDRTGLLSSQRSFQHNKSQSDGEAREPPRKVPPNRSIGVAVDSA